MAFPIPEKRSGITWEQLILQQSALFGKHNKHDWFSLLQLHFFPVHFKYNMESYYVLLLLFSSLLFIHQYDCKYRPPSRSRPLSRFQQFDKPPATTQSSSGDEDDDDEEEDDEEDEKTGQATTGSAVAQKPAKPISKPDQKTNAPLSEVTEDSNPVETSDNIDPGHDQGYPITDEDGMNTPVPVEDRPRGPIVVEEALEEKYSATFTPDAENIVPWHEPEVTGNCWVQAMLSNKYDFSPQCNLDGSYAAKQCYLERCWCTNRDGTPQIGNSKDRFFFEIRGITLRCIQNGIPV